MWSGDADELGVLISELETSSNPIMQAHGRLLRAEHRLHNDPTFGLDELRSIAEDARAILEPAGDDAGLSRVWSLLGFGHWFRCRGADTLDCFERARLHAREGKIFNVRWYGLLAGPLINGPFMPDEARARIRELLAEDKSRFLAQAALLVEAMLARYEGNFDECMAKWREGDAILGELGLTMLQLVMRQIAAECAFLRGETDEAIRIYRSVYEGLGELGETGFRSTASIAYGEVLYATGELDEAERLAMEAETMSSSDDLANFAAGRMLRARILADRHQTDVAEELAREAVGYAELSDFPQTHGRAYEALAYVLRAAGKDEEAAAAAEHAATAHERHGDVVCARRARSLLVEL
jgi:tetratricopeptide (TPR) repeat protein